MCAIQIEDDSLSNDKTLLLSFSITKDWIFMKFYMVVNYYLVSLSLLTTSFLYPNQSNSMANYVKVTEICLKTLFITLTIVGVNKKFTLHSTPPQGFGEGKQINWVSIIVTLYQLYQDTFTIIRNKSL